MNFFFLVANDQPLATANDKTIADHQPQTTSNDKSRERRFGFGGKYDKRIPGQQPLTTANDKTMADKQWLEDLLVFVVTRSYVIWMDGQLVDKGWRICLLLLSLLFDVPRGIDLREWY